MEIMRWFKYAILVPGVVSVGYALWGHDDVIKGLLPVIAGVAATMLGFLVTALSILMTLSGHRLIENMRRTGHMKRMVNGFFVAGIMFLGTLVFSLISLIFPDLALNFFGVLSSIFLFSALYFFISGGWWFYLVVEHLSSNHNSPG